MDDKTRNAIALKKFSIIGPVLNGQVDNNVEYFRKVANSPIEMPYYGMRNYSYKTLESWLCDYNKRGLEGLVRGTRCDKGKSRKISQELGEEIVARRKANPALPITLLYEQMVSDKLIDPLNISRPTVYRYIEDLSLAGEFKDNTQKPEPLRFSYEHAGDLWQGDALYGPYITVGRKKLQTYLHMFIDDASRYIVGIDIFFNDSFVNLMSVMKRAITRHGRPKVLNFDNGPSYKNKQMKLLAARIGTTISYCEPYTPTSKAKIERWFRTLRDRWMSQLNMNDFTSISELKESLMQYVTSYNRTIHSSLDGKSPEDRFFSESQLIKRLTNEQIEQYFLLEYERRVSADNVVLIDETEYEVDYRYSRQKVTLRYSPDLSKIYVVDKFTGELTPITLLNKQDNSQIKRKKIKEIKEIKREK